MEMLIFMAGLVIITAVICYTIFKTTLKGISYTIEEKIRYKVDARWRREVHKAVEDILSSDSEPSK